LLRGQIGIVTQRPYLFGGNIRRNIELSNPKMPHEMVVDAAKLACIHDEIVAMPMGYDTPLILTEVCRSPEDSSSESPLPEQWPIAPTSCCSTRPPAISTPSTSEWSSTISARSAARGCARLRMRASAVRAVGRLLVLGAEEDAQGQHSRWGKRGKGSADPSR
jgi:hypothetical protein